MLRSLSRLGHVWVENPVSLILFVPRLGRALLFTLEEMGSRKIIPLAGRLLKQVWKTFLRGIVPVLVFGVAGGIGVGSLLGTTGTVVRQFFESTLLPILLRDALPLLTALIVIARSGATIAAKFASSPAAEQKRSHTFNGRELQHLVLPHLIASVMTTPVFYLIIALLLIGGYGSLGTYFGMLKQEAFLLLEINQFLQRTLIRGILLSALFGGIAAFVATAFGIQAAERYVSDLDETHDLHYAVWESSVTSLLLCLLLTLTTRSISL